MCHEILLYSLISAIFVMLIRLIRSFSMISPAEQCAIPFKTQPSAPTPRSSKSTVLKNGIKVVTKGQVSAVS